MSLYSYCVYHRKEYLLKQWDAEKNTPMSPDSIASTSTERVWWKCERGHAWQTQLASRARGNSGCPICLREKIAVRVEKRRAAEVKKKQNRQRNSETEGGAEK